MMFGIHAASMGWAPEFMANVELMVCNMMYVKLSARPIPRYIPMPPFRFRDDNEKPMVVSMKLANDMAMRLWYSTSYWTTFTEPREICFEM